jgi:monothiol glutaredoxin
MFLEDQNLREGIKTFSDWPTIPQLYIKKEFIGGCDIVKEMYENGELKKVLEDKGISFKK